IFGDIFGDIFGQGGGGRRRRGRGRSSGRPGEDLSVDLDVKFEEAAFGKTETLEVWREAACEKCSGTGSKSGKATSCATCGGAGEVHFQQGFFSVSRPCPTCHGEGITIKDPCDAC